jgi:CheY-like chemotaxis protein
MNFLIVEDDENKRLQLKQFLEDLRPSATCRIARSLQSGIRALKETSPDVVILDMTLPNFDTGPDEPGGQIYPLGGREFLEQMARFDIMVPVIVVTQFETFGKGSRQLNIETLDHQLRRDFGDVYKGTVYYHAAIHGWKEQLAKSVEDLDDELKRRSR